MKKILLIISIVSLFQLQGSEALSFDPAATKALFNAIENKDIEGIERALEAGADPNGINSEGNTPLTFAAEFNIWQAVPILVEKGADINEGDFWAWTPLIMAANKGYAKMVQMLLKHGAIVNVDGAFVVKALMTGEHILPSIEILGILFNAQAGVAAKDNERTKALNCIDKALKRSSDSRLEKFQRLLIDQSKEQQAAMDAAAALSELQKKKNSLIEKQIAKMIG